MAEAWSYPSASTSAGAGLVSWPREGREESTDETAGSHEPEFISIPEWARRLGISAESAYKAARLGQIPGCFNIGRLYRVNWPVLVEATSSMRSGGCDSS